MFGFLNINKPVGLTSHDVVARVRRQVGRGVKVGHAGTLDPFATGVLVVCLGPATRLADYVQAATKRYRTVVTLGATSTTDDTEGEIVAQEVPVPPTAESVRAACAAFVGDILQTPPNHSAVHIDGQRAYKLARRGETVELTPREVRIHVVDIVDYAYPSLTLDIHCGSGTYIRSIARDLGVALGTGGYCSQLERTAIGEFLVADAKAIDELVFPADVQNPLLALADWPKLTVPSELLRDMNDGKALPLDLLTSDSTDTPSTVALLDDAGTLLALAEVIDDVAKPKKVFRVPE